VNEPVPAKKKALPEWAQRLVPVDMDGAATLLGVSRRSLQAIVRIYPHYELRGNRKVFYPEHIEALREALRERHRRIYRHSPAARYIPLPVSSEEAYRRALALVREGKRGRRTKMPTA